MGKKSPIDTTQSGHIKGRRGKDGAWHAGEDRVTMTTWRNTSQWESQGSDSSNTSLAQFPDHWPRCLLPVAYSTFPRAGLTPQTSTGPSPFFQDLNNVKSTHLEFHYLRDSLDEWVTNVFKKLSSTPDNTFIVKIAFPQRNINVRIQVPSAGCLGMRA